MLNLLRQTCTRKSGSTVINCINLSNSLIFTAIFLSTLLRAYLLRKVKPRKLTPKFQSWKGNSQVDLPTNWEKFQWHITWCEPEQPNPTVWWLTDLELKRWLKSHRPFMLCNYATGTSPSLFLICNCVFKFATFSVNLHSQSRTNGLKTNVWKMVWWF